MLRIIFVLFALNFTGFIIYAQNPQLAIQYYQNAEYEKAASMFETLWKKNPQNYSYLQSYINSLYELNAYEKAQNLLHKVAQERKSTPIYYMLGEFYSRRSNTQANEAFENAIDALPPNLNQINKLAQDLSRIGKDTLAIETYLKGRKILKDDYVFSYNLGAAYQKLGDYDKMIDEFLLSLEENPSRLQTVKGLFQRYFSKEEHYKLLQQKVFRSVQKKPEANHYPDLLAWAFIQDKNYKMAFRQLSALDRRNNENGNRIYQLAQTASNDDNYDAAIMCYEYIIKNKDASNPFYYIAQEQILSNRLKKITSITNYDRSEVDTLLREYDSFLNLNGLNPSTARMAMNKAEVMTRYANQNDKAVSLLKRVVNLTGLPSPTLAEAKIQLADYLLIRGDRWEATLLYAQVDKANPEAEFGELARFKNAMLSYYFGDFEWAQEQFSILKAATSRFISNDAIDRSVFIMDNLNLDTTPHPMRLYAEAELLLFQNKFGKAQEKLDSIEVFYPEHGLLDDILYTKGNIAEKQMDYPKAISLYKKIVESHGDDLRADNALNKLAHIYDVHLDNKEEAMKYYEKIYLDYANSTLASYARKRFRILRGDNIQ